ncbi:organic cation transporter-like protein isoform X1 [Fundulus heteroclitus]|uniref:organic cation transporter-like protein isoform X1 n=1 Tax=Fundulus heteroclitus TaxID=8078 RepID=UPI00165AB06D|nr:organic cation transporter-like protein isoform X1 [Fundulus heteroclitus]
MSPLQLSVYWRLSLLFFFTPFLFFLDIFAAAVAARTCRRDNASDAAAASWRGALPPDADWSNQSQRGDAAEADADWRTEPMQEESVCSWTDWLSYGQTVYMVGLLLGSVVGGAVSDRYGKRPVLLACACVHALCGLVPAVFPQPLLFLAVRCLTAVCCCCINICAFSLAVEWTLPAARLWPPAFLPFCFSLGTMAGAPLAWLSPTWTYLHLSLALPQIICLPLYLSIPESPRWLLLWRRKDVLEGYRSNSPADQKCLDLLLDSAWSDLQSAAEAQAQTAGGGGHAPGDVAHLRHPTILLRLFIMSYLSAATALTYYGICLNIGSFGVGVYAAQFFSGLSEAPSLLVPLIRLGRRLICMLALFLSGAACFISLLLSRYHGTPALVMGLALLGKLCILAATFISVLYCIELFPTVVRYKTALHISGQPFIPTRLSGHHLRASRPHWSHLIGCHGGVQQRTNRRLRSVPAAARNQRGTTPRLLGGLQQAAQEPSSYLRRPLEATDDVEQPNQDRDAPARQGGHPNTKHTVSSRVAIS